MALMQRSSVGNSLCKVNQASCFLTGFMLTYHVRLLVYCWEPAYLLEAFLVYHAPSNSWSVDATYLWICSISLHSRSNLRSDCIGLPSWKYPDNFAHAQKYPQILEIHSGKLLCNAPAHWNSLSARWFYSGLQAQCFRFHSRSLYLSTTWHSRDV